jgi:hypothetical protein
MLFLFALRFALLVLPVAAQAQAIEYDAAPGVVTFGAVEQAPPQVFQLGQPLSLNWDANIDEVTHSITAYRITLDGTVTDYAGPLRQANYRWQLPPAGLAIGTHEIRMVACNVSAVDNSTRCGPDGGALAFIVDRPLPGRPTYTIAPNTPFARISEGTADSLAQSYFWIVLGRKPSTQEMRTLENEYGNRPLTREDVIAFLDTKLIGLVGR